MAGSFEVGCFFPYSEIEVDPGAIRDFAVAVEEMGYDYLANADHVIGVHRESRPDWPGHYDVTERFYEPMVLLSHLAAVTSRLRFVTSVVVAPQRQTALFAQQAAHLDLLSGGRLKIGVATGWNQVEHEAMGMDFATRGSRLDEQIAVLRALWTGPHVQFDTQFHAIRDCALTVMPVQRPIPIIVGGNADVAMRRAARLGDGWMPFLTADGAEEKIGRYHEAVRAAGRDPADAPLHVLCHLGGGGRDGAGDGTIRTAEKVAEDVETWRRAGAGMVIVNTLDSGVGGAAQHLEVYGRIAECLGLARR